MAQPVAIPGATKPAKISNVLGVGVLSFFFSIIYLWIFWWRTNRELADYGRSKDTEECGTSPGKSLLAVTLGALIIVPALISFFRMHKRIVAAQQLAGVTPLNGWISLILYIIFSPAWIAYMQSGLNPVWETLPAAPVAAEPAALAAESAADAPAVDTSSAADTPAADTGASAADTPAADTPDDAPTN